ncbi:histidine triad (HIT) family protein [Diaminobutyricimonas aerilata]|uniref:Histidine triad (HIT) family protein n=1 Tax=Diaminobutyricimonas aerilata TaxID=1162967 RepID=A0A2M9CJD9_9MICO|nr:histidine triad nucleotide-binding protein [Diaminobutyricimonas aerilata]PJJ72017.1 histidine triad (HIT) family protein [Diaminobutyricimonas aerilata]
MTDAERSIFTRIADREIPADIVHETDSLIAFRDIAPQAPVHLLIVPKTERYANVVELAEGDPALLADIVSTAGRLAHEHTGGQFRLVFNTGAEAGQTVFHVHAHLLGGRLEEGTLAH